MNCKKKHTRSILVNFLGKSYIDKLYKTDITDLLFKEEMILVPRSLPEIKKRKDIRALESKIDTINLEFEQKKIDPKTLEYHEEKWLTYGRDTFYRKQIVELKGLTLKTKMIKQYKYPCAGILCNGFVDSSWTCSICDKETCKICHSIKEEGHECKQEDIDTIELIKKDSKSCPKCNMSIMKTSGCDQMWCISCHTTFDWKTLNIKTSGIVHNPEYFRYMRENGIAIPRNPNDNPCMNEYDDAYETLTGINSEYIKEEKMYATMRSYIAAGSSILIRNYLTHEIHQKNMEISEELNVKAENYANKKINMAKEYVNRYTIINAINKDFMKTIFTFYRDINHLESVEMTQMQNKINSSEQWKDDIRVNYLDKIISEDKYKSDLVRQHKEQEYLQETMGYHYAIVEVCKAYFISKINKLTEEINTAIETKTAFSIKECSQLMCLRDLVNDIVNNGENIKRVYGYTRLEYLPRLVNIGFYKRMNT
tara:strand:+ start:662 stop:2104 length:1443 start_codon:yes stop_codon:yes gene_type:complete